MDSVKLADDMAFLRGGYRESERSKRVDRVQLHIIEVTRERDSLEVENQRLTEALREIAGDSPTSHRRTFDQLTDAVKWRQGIARDALARAVLAGRKDTPA